MSFKSPGKRIGWNLRQYRGFSGLDGSRMDISTKAGNHRQGKGYLLAVSVPLGSSAPVSQHACGGWSGSAPDSDEAARLLCGRG